VSIRRTVAVSLDTRRGPRGESQRCSLLAASAADRKRPEQSKQQPARPRAGSRGGRSVGVPNGPPVRPGCIGTTTERSSTPVAVAMRKSGQRDGSFGPSSSTAAWKQKQRRRATEGAVATRTERKHRLAPLLREEGASAKPAPCHSTAFALVRPRRAGRGRQGALPAARPRRRLRLLPRLRRGRAGLVVLRLRARRPDLRPRLALDGRGMGARTTRRGVPVGEGNGGGGGPLSTQPWLRAGWPSRTVGVRARERGSGQSGSISSLKVELRGPRMLLARRALAPKYPPADVSVVPDAFGDVGNREPVDLRHAPDSRARQHHQHFSSPRLDPVALSGSRSRRTRPTRPRWVIGYSARVRKGGALRTDPDRREVV
jgi:hypothetical protein